MVRKGPHTYSYVVLRAIKDARVAGADRTTAPAATAPQDAVHCAPPVLPEEHTGESAPSTESQPQPVARPSLAAAVHALRAAGAKTRKQMHHMLDA